MKLQSFKHLTHWIHWCNTTNKHSKHIHDIRVFRHEGLWKKTLQYFNPNPSNCNHISFCFKKRAYSSPVSFELAAHSCLSCDYRRLPQPSPPSCFLSVHAHMYTGNSICYVVAQWSLAAQESFDMLTWSIRPLCRLICELWCDPPRVFHTGQAELITLPALFPCSFTHAP